MSLFKFKKFVIKQDKAAMKVGTDGVLLGAWCNLNTNPSRVLDVGSGTGLISLMIAQRCDSVTIDAVELDICAYEQTIENFELSSWSNRLFCYKLSFQNFVNEIKIENKKYELIISNPPFFSSNCITRDDSKNKARFTSTLSFKDLLCNCKKILSKKGKLFVIIPFDQESFFLQIAKEYLFFLNKICYVRGSTTSRIKRCLLEFSFNKTQIIKNELIIEKSRHNYTDKYIELTKDFYLKM